LYKSIAPIRKGCQGGSADKSLAYFLLAGYRDPSLPSQTLTLENAAELLLLSEHLGCTASKS
jgi:hypothetical protein